MINSFPQQTLSLWKLRLSACLRLEVSRHKPVFNCLGRECWISHKITPSIASFSVFSPLHLFLFCSFVSCTPSGRIWNAGGGRKRKERQKGREISEEVFKTRFNSFLSLVSIHLSFFCFLSDELYISAHRDDCTESCRSKGKSHKKCHNNVTGCCESSFDQSCHARN